MKTKFLMLLGVVTISNLYVTPGFSTSCKDDLKICADAYTAFMKSHTTDSCKYCTHECGIAKQTCYQPNSTKPGYIDYVTANTNETECSNECPL